MTTAVASHNNNLLASSGDPFTCQAPKYIQFKKLGNTESLMSNHNTSEIQTYAQRCDAEFDKISSKYQDQSWA